MPPALPQPAGPAGSAITCAAATNGTGRWGPARPLVWETETPAVLELCHNVLTGSRTRPVPRYGPEILDGLARQFGVGKPAAGKSAFVWHTLNKPHTCIPELKSGTAQHPVRCSSPSRGSQQP